MKPLLPTAMLRLDVGGGQGPLVPHGGTWQSATGSSVVGFLAGWILLAVAAWRMEAT